MYPFKWSLKGIGWLVSQKVCGANYCHIFQWILMKLYIHDHYKEWMCVAFVFFWYSVCPNITELWALVLQTYVVQINFTFFSELQWNFIHITTMKGRCAWKFSSWFSQMLQSYWALLQNYCATNYFHAFSGFQQIFVYTFTLKGSWVWLYLNGVSMQCRFICHW